MPHQSLTLSVGEFATQQWHLLDALQEPFGTTGNLHEMTQDGLTDGRPQFIPALQHVLPVRLFEMGRHCLE